MQSATRLRMYGLAYITASSPLPGSRFSADGCLQLHQAAPLPASIISVAPEKPFLDSSAAIGGTAAQADVLLRLDSLFARYQERNVTTTFENRYPVWKVCAMWISNTPPVFKTLKSYLELFCTWFVLQNAQLHQLLEPQFLSAGPTKHYIATSLCLDCHWFHEQYTTSIIASINTSKVLLVLLP